MKSLDEILNDPKAHGAMPSELEVASWNEEVLRRWSKEQEAGRELRLGFASRPIAAVLFWGCVGFGALSLGSLLWDSRGSSLDSLREFTTTAPIATLESLAAYPWLLAGLALGLAIAATRPLREFLLHQLD